MKKYFVITISDLTKDQIELTSAQLYQFGIEGIEEQENLLIAYAEESAVLAESIGDFLNSQGLSFQIKLVDEQNWNAAWEANFEPVVIANKIHVRAHFHPIGYAFEHDILITPKMSFGTGHHATTSMVMKAMLDIEFNDKRVIDFGTGTGILAILAVQRGAKIVYAIDNDEWSINNVHENVQLNHVEEKIEVRMASDLKDIPQSDVLLANINKNVLIEHVSSLYQLLFSKGVLIISGLLATDYEDIMNVFKNYFGLPVRHLQEEKWMALVFSK